MRENSSRNQDGLKYQKLYNWGRTLIMSGVLRNMDKFPSEHMLQNKFGCSRQTVRNALDRLEQDGLIARVKGPRYVSPLMVKLNFGSYCKKIENAKSANDWLTRDEAVVNAYDADGLCTFQFTASTYREMLATLNHVSSKAWAESINKDLPVLLIAGDGDPVGDYGKGVRKVWAMLGDAGVKDLTCQIFEGGRHELHNETNREEVFDYVYGWLMDRLPEDESQ